MSQETEIIVGADGIIVASARVENSVHELLTGEFHVAEIYYVLQAIIRAAEIVVQGNGQGAIKHELVKKIWHQLDEQYGFISKIDDAIKTGIFEMIDGYIIRRSIDMMIMIVVTVLNATGIFTKGT